MTVRAYISDKLKAFGISEAQLVDMSLSSGLELESDISTVDPAKVGIAVTHMLEEAILAPRMTNINESGFSMSWDFNSVSQYYLWLCRKWGVKPNDDVLSMLGLSTITDRSDMW